MKKKPIYTAFVLLFIVAVLFAFVRYRSKERKNEIAFYELQDRKGALALSPEWASTRNTAATLFRAVRENPQDKKSALGLAAIFIQEARVTGNYQYYDKAAMKQVDNVLKEEPDNFQALTFKALIYLSQHHFADGLSIAAKAQKINPYNAFIYGLLVDANVELGDYKAAVDNAEKMISIRPDLRSYSRISYLREIHGDYPGAIDAMNFAVDAGMPGDEATEWTRVQLGHLYEMTGDIKSATLQYSIALNERPYYPYAMSGMAHIALAQKSYRNALQLYLQADSLVSDHSFKEQLADVYTLLGENKKAKDITTQLIKQMSAEAVAAINDENTGHYNDKELAYAYLKINDVNRALQHATAEYNRRPKNIEVNETMAWVNYCKGNFQEAVPYIAEALKTKSRNPVLLCHAGLIYKKTGDTGKAKAFLEEALKNGPNIPEALQNESRQALQSL
jgi:tetratricopeptide (TPR) repeat protein